MRVRVEGGNKMAWNKCLCMKAERDQSRSIREIIIAPSIIIERGCIDNMCPLKKPPSPHVSNTWLGVWSRDDERWNDKVGPWDISSQREACSWRCSDTAGFQRESGDVREAITALWRRSAQRYQSGETRAFVFVTTPISSTVSARADTPVTSSVTYFIFQFQAPLCMNRWCNNWTVNSPACRCGWACQSQLFSVFVFYFHTTWTSLRTSA